MSGICGLIHFDRRPVERSDLRPMAEAAAHRGPDGIRFHIDGHVGLAHLALNITPESLLEKQPVVSPDGTLILTADARIDNRDDLIEALGGKDLLAGENPTDADLIMAAYRNWGPECPAHLLGDFAFGIWDASNRRFFAARDPMAIRAFYYRIEPHRLLFGTEVKQILAATEVPCRLFEPAVAAHLAGPYGRPEWSFYEGISQLPPAHALVADASGSRVHRYWDIDPEDRIRHRREEKYWEHFREEFTRAVRCRIRSVKPVAVSLSGGTDSGSIAAMAGWLRRRDQSLCPDLRAYCYAFDNRSQGDERHISDKIVRHYDLSVTEVPADQMWPLKDYPEHGPDRDDPFTGVYQALMDRTIEAARKDGAAVLLFGERGDEVVGTWVYDHLGLLATGRWKTLWGEFRAGAQVYGVPSHRLLQRELLRPLASWAARPQRRSQEFAPWIRPEFAARTGLRELISDNSALTSYGSARQQRHNVIFSSNSMRRVVWIERSHAIFQLGFADPWSDRRVVQAVLSMPQWAVNRVAESKRLARQALRGVVPESVRLETRKTEPSQLFDLGLRRLARETVLNLVRDSHAASLGYIDSRALLDCYESFCAGKPMPYDFWWPLSLEMWLRRFWGSAGRRTRGQA